MIHDDFTIDTYSTERLKAHNKPLWLFPFQYLFPLPLLFLIDTGEQPLNGIKEAIAIQSDKLTVVIRISSTFWTGRTHTLTTTHQDTTSSTMHRKPTSYNGRRANRPGMFRGTLRNTDNSLSQEAHSATAISSSSTTSAAPQLSKVPRSSLARRRAARSAEFQEKLRVMSLELSPLVQLTTGAVHPDFPRRVVQFWLLTDEQLESLAGFYHQREVCEFTAQYPCPVRWDSALPLEDKRRKMGRFIGLRGCESPVYLKTEEDIARDARWARYIEDDERRRRKWFDLTFER